MKRTSNDNLGDLNNAPDLQRLVNDKRSSKRATTAKGHRRNRRYENRILNAQVQEDFNEDGEESEDSVKDYEVEHSSIGVYKYIY
jgi:hypothetical protein